MAVSEKVGGTPPRVYFSPDPNLYGSDQNPASRDQGMQAPPHNGRTIGRSVGPPQRCAAACVGGWLIYSGFNTQRHRYGAVEALNLQRFQRPETSLQGLVCPLEDPPGRWRFPKRLGGLRLAFYLSSDPNLYGSGKNAASRGRTRQRGRTKRGGGSGGGGYRWYGRGRAKYKGATPCNTGDRLEYGRATLYNTGGDPRPGTWRLRVGTTLYNTGIQYPIIRRHPTGIQAGTRPTSVIEAVRPRGLSIVTTWSTGRYPPMI